MNIELAVMAVALFLSTVNILVYSWLETQATPLDTRIRVLRIVAVTPAFLASAGSVYMIATDRESPLGMALLTAGMLLIVGAIQLISLVTRRQKQTETLH